MTGLRLATGLLLVTSAASAAVPDQNWVGTIYCGPIPDIARVPLQQPFRLEVRGGVARYERDIRVADTAIASGSRERGEGVVGPDLRVTLQGSGQVQGGAYRSEFTGALAPNGQTRLDGVQHWRFNRHADFDRACRLDLHREG